MLPNILYIVGAILPSQNASSIHTYKMANSLSKISKNVYVIAKIDDKNKISKFYGGSNCNVDYIESAGFISRFFHMMKYALKSNIIYTRWLYAAFLLPFFDKKIIFEFHTSLHSIRSNILFFLIKKYKHKCKLIFISTELKIFFEKKYSLSSFEYHVAHDGADVVDLKFTNQNKIAKCGYIGSFKKGKGVERIINIANNMSHVDFHIFGGTEKEISNLKKECINDNVIFHGFIEPSKLSYMMSFFDIALLPNQENVYIDNVDIGRWTSPLKLFEYMAYGKSIVATNLPVFREVLEDHFDSYLCDTKNIQEWIDSIDKLSADLHLRTLLFYRVRQKLSSLYSWDARARNILSD